MNLDQERLTALDRVTLAHGSHTSLDEGACAMELVSYIAGEKEFSDHPACACPLLTGFVISLNDNWTGEDRQGLKPFLPRLIGTRSTKAVETQRAIACLDWTMRVHRPLWLDAAGFTEHAAKMRAPEIVDEASFRVAEAAQAEAIADAWAAWAARDAWDARDAWAAWNARAARAAWAARDAWAAWNARAARAAWAARDAWDAWNARDAWDARDAWATVGVLVAARAGDALGADAKEQQRIEAGVAALKAVAAQVRTAELELLDRLIGIGG
jgi:hypothetical protein